MHIPNGFLSDPVCTATALAATAAVGMGVVRLRQVDRGRSSALMAATGAGIFAAQMVNFPIDPGTSAHVLGAALAAIVLGPWAGMLTMSIVLAGQCLLLGDGGLGALGANILNMAVAGTLTASVIYSGTTRSVAGRRGNLLGAGLAAFGSVISSASLCAAELAASGTHSFGEVLAAMLQVHAAIGISEALITVAILALAWGCAASPSLSARRVSIGGLGLSAAVAGLVAPLASSAPDGLERVALDLRFANLASGSWTIVPDWAIAMPLVGIAGGVIVFASSYAVGRTAAVKVRKG